jgi:hypothetical protein
MANRMNSLRHLLASRQRRRNARVLLGFILFAMAVITVDTFLCELLMWRFEGQTHSWMAALYWVLSTMTTLGVGDIVFVSDVFVSDIGRLFTSFVLISGIVLFLIVLPFSFIRYFYVP